MALKTAKRRKGGRARGGSSRAAAGSLPILDQPDAMPQPRRSFAKWRALSLSLVYVLFAAHILHWKLTGRTLAPLELNEVMYTLELGIITAGFLFMCALVAGTLIFGRFFCSWACHILVLQDLCAWVLRKLRIRRKPIRSRLLLLVPPLTAFYMFLWPQVLRAWERRALPEFHFRTDAEGWASFATTNFWRNLPSAPVIALTFLVCGFVIVYLLGSRTFCTYVCPYGAIFALADRFAPGRIQVNDKCVQCGTCTASCTSGVRVHEEVKQHGMIVNSACMKDLDCVSACPQEALHYGFTMPSFFKSFKSGGRFGRLPYDFSLGEEVLMAAVFGFVLLTFRGLYSRFPFLLSLALGGIFAYLTILALRLARRPDVLLSTHPLKRQGRLTRAGRGFVAVAAVLAAFVGHSAFVRYHEYTGLRQAFDLRHGGAAGDADAAARSARAHLQAAGRWGLIDNPRIERGLADVSLRLGRSLSERGRFAEAARQLRSARRLAPDRAAVHAELGSAEAELGHLAEAVASLREAVRLDPHLGKAHFNLGTLLAHENRFEEAVVHYRAALDSGHEDADAFNNLGFALWRMGRMEESREALERAIALNANHAHAHFNLARVLAGEGRRAAAERHLRAAARLDARYAEILQDSR